MKRHTLRGQFTEGETKRLIIDDGRLTRAMRVVSFVIGGEPAATTGGAYATLKLESAAPTDWDWGDNRQIAWASVNNASGSELTAPYSVIDPDHMVIQDLYIGGNSAQAGSTGKINYLVVLEAIEISSDQSILQMLKERSQNASR